MTSYLSFFFWSFFVSLLPQEVKKQPPWREFNSAGMHIFSGIVESLICGFLFLRGLINYVSSFSDIVSSTIGDILEANLPPTEGSVPIGAAGLLAYVSYFLHPVSLLTFYCFIEGLLRSLEVAFSLRHLGLTFVYIPYKLGGWLGRIYERKKRQFLVGPKRPDEVDLREDSSLLRIYSVKDKPWPENQVLKYKGEFYVLVLKDFTRRGQHYAYKYVCREAKPSESVVNFIEFHPST